LGFGIRARNLSLDIDWKGMQANVAHQQEQDKTRAIAVSRSCESDVG